MQENDDIKYIKKYIKELKNEILEKQTELNKLISILNNENDTEFID
jgi:mRNA-degrading endonuclease YafQ of YafQ-DinJ toxin-antitoxin module